MHVEEGDSVSGAPGSSSSSSLTKEIPPSSLNTGLQHEIFLIAKGA